MEAIAHRKSRYFDPVGAVDSSTIGGPPASEYDSIRPIPVAGSTCLGRATFVGWALPERCPAQPLAVGSLRPPAHRQRIGTVGGQRGQLGPENTRRNRELRPLRSRMDNRDRAAVRQRERTAEHVVVPGDREIAFGSSIRRVGHAGYRED